MLEITCFLTVRDKKYGREQQILMLDLVMAVIFLNISSLSLSKQDFKKKSSLKVLTSLLVLEA